MWFSRVTLNCLVTIRKREYENGFRTEKGEELYGRGSLCEEGPGIRFQWGPSGEDWWDRL